MWRPHSYQSSSLITAIQCRVLWSPIILLLHIKCTHLIINLIIHWCKRRFFSDGVGDNLLFLFLSFPSILYAASPFCCLSFLLPFSTFCPCLILKIKWIQTHGSKCLKKKPSTLPKWMSMLCHIQNQQIVWESYWKLVNMHSYQPYYATVTLLH